MLTCDECLPWPDVWLVAILLCLGESDMTTDCHRMNKKSPRLGKQPTKFDSTNDLEHLKPMEQNETKEISFAADIILIL